ncbi:tRNA pseudouridine(55) synthase TruB [Faecalibacillus intestinalis]|uniref:tRNA pseudouridine(55) synthase TruB n=1 Tax=Faecalibacillus intestinalis TaxID=1982626 RepID=UPI00352155AA
MDGILLINKPAGYTSHDIVGIVRKKLHTKKVGHCGTLDPDATGVLVVCVNKATKAIQFLMSDTKVYRATLSLGKSTDTYDASGKILEEKEVGQISKAQVIDVLNSFLGKSKQKPPIYSAIKVNGKKLYEYARNGEEVEIKERDIEIMMIELIDFSNNEIVFDVKCSKGTYIRSLCVDIAKKLGYPGHMSHLERRQAGRFLITDCITLEQLENDDYSLHSIDDALCGFSQLKLDDPTPVYHGKQIKSDLTGQVAIYDNQNRLLAIYESTGQGYLKNVRGLW